MSERAAVLLRLSPDLLERIDQRRGAMKRTPWLAEVIAAHLDDLDRGDEGRDPGAQFGSLATRASAGALKRTVRDEDGTDLGLRASRREDGVLEIAAADAPESSSRTDADGSGGPPGGRDPAIDAASPREPEGADNGSAPISPTSPPRPEQGPDPVAAVGGNPGEIPVDGSGGLGPDLSAFEDIP